jgi:hypothetical protein
VSCSAIQPYGYGIPCFGLKSFVIPPLERYKVQTAMNTIYWSYVFPTHVSCLIGIFFFSLALHPPWALPLLSVLWSFLQTVGLLGQVISSSQGLYLNTGQHKHRINTYTH